MLTHKQLRYFVEIVDAGSFSLASERLFIAQSALSRQVQEMERELQVPLLQRDARPLEMTPGGHSLYADARRILAALDAATASARSAQRGNEGCVQLLHSSSVPLTRPMLALLQRHGERHPGVSIAVSQASSEQQALDIDQGRADVGLARGPILRRYPGIHYERLYREPLVAAVAASHPLAARGGVAVAELRDEPFVALPHLERGGLSHRVAELCRARGFQPVGAAVRSRKWSQLALVQGGFGIAIVPRSMGLCAPDGVCLLALDEEDCTAEVLALWRREAPQHVRNFADTLHRMLGSPAAPGI